MQDRIWQSSSVIVPLQLAVRCQVLSASNKPFALDRQSTAETWWPEEG